MHQNHHILHQKRKKKLKRILKYMIYLEFRHRLLPCYFYVLTQCVFVWDLAELWAIWTNFTFNQSKNKVHQNHHILHLHCIKSKNFWENIKVYNIFRHTLVPRDFHLKAIYIRVYTFFPPNWMQLCFQRRPYWVPANGPLIELSCTVVGIKTC